MGMITLRLWDKLYGYATLPPDLRASIAYVLDKPATVGLKGGGVIRDQGNRITVKGSSEEALRVIIAQAKAKGWTGLSVRGSEEYLEMAERVGAEIGFQIKAHDTDMHKDLDEVEKPLTIGLLKPEKINKIPQPPIASLEPKVF